MANDMAKENPNDTIRLEWLYTMCQHLAVENLFAFAAMIRSDDIGFFCVFNADKYRFNTALELAAIHLYLFFRVNMYELWL